jgi:hypothetical protein
MVAWDVSGPSSERGCWALRLLGVCSDRMSTAKSSGRRRWAGPAAFVLCWCNPRCPPAFTLSPGATFEVPYAEGTLRSLHS